MSNLNVSNSAPSPVAMQEQMQAMQNRIKELEAKTETPKKHNFSEIVKDQVNIDRGLKPLGKGLLAGGIAGTVTGAALAATLSHNLIGVFGDYTVGGAAKVGGIIGGVVGAASGAVSANFVDNKAINVAIGAVAGGVASGAVGAGWLIGGLAGAAGAYAGSSMIEKQ